MEPERKRTIAFIDGQNLYFAVKYEFGYTFPNFDVAKLASAICSRANWDLTQVRFYTGVPPTHANPRWHDFWVAKLAAMGQAGIHVYSRPLVTRDGQMHEKGIDVRISLDIVRLASKNEFDVALVFSQDQDLSEAAAEIRQVAAEDRRWIKVASSFPLRRSPAENKGINYTDWLPFDKALYDTCIDPRDYRAKPAPS
ncbi:MAG: NYN domain-containing protein [bacterium]